ncbi:hypothetical protein BC943DRAFT_317833 [Umbelopsis sp. AD052]|nr:hypothetical protein BC943DRAFT_317833 [Umbelopsis sp. AD052]
MFFARQQKTPVVAFNLSLCNHSPTAFGPGSVINGSLVLELGKPVKANHIRVVFDCKEMEKSKCLATIFSVETAVWSAIGKSNEKDILESGRHLFLFAIKLPSVNYPPSIKEPQLSHSIVYSLQGFFNANDLTQMSSNTVPIVYYPLVNSQDLSPASASNPSSKVATFHLEKDKLPITVKAEVTKPSHCPGDVCVVRTTIHNPTDIKISHVQVSLIANTRLYQGSLTPFSTHNSEAPIVGSNSQPSKNITQTLFSENVYINMPRKGHEAHNVFRVNIPKDCPPSTGSNISRAVERSYDVVIRLPVPLNQQSPRSSGKWTFTGLLSAPKDDTNNQNKSVQSKEAALSLPVNVVTVPSQSLPPQLKISLPSFNDQPDLLPVFVSEHESPLPSPVSPSLDDGWSIPGSPLSTSAEGVDGFYNIDDVSMAQNASGHLMVPTLKSKHRSSVSTTSSSSTEQDHGSRAISQEPSNQVLVN